MTKKVTAEVSDLDIDWDTLSDWQKKSRGYSVTLRYEGRRMTVPFFMGTGLKRIPTAEDVLECLVSDTQSVIDGLSFEEWLDEFGYDSDSIKAHKEQRAAYKSCKSIHRRLEKLLGTELLHQLTGGDIEASDVAEGE